MSKLRFAALGLVLILICGGTLVGASDKEEKLCIPVGTIELAPPEKVEAKKSLVEFPHSLHFTNKCQECHHKWDLYSDLSGCMATGCHDLATPPKKSEKVDAIRYYKRAFHSKCIGCHREIKKKNRALEKKAVLSAKGLELKTAGPTGCRDCHPSD